MTVKLVIVPAAHVDKAWAAGASRLAESCDVSCGDVTGDQLKYLIAHDKMALVRMDRDGHTAGWGAVSVVQKPNARVLEVHQMWAPNGDFPEFFSALKDMAAAAGCSRVRCEAYGARSTLYQRVGFNPIRTVLEVVL